MHHIVRIAHAVVAHLTTLLFAAAPVLAGDKLPVSAAGWMYWAEPNGNAIMRAHLDGTSPQILYSGLDGINVPHCVALDVAGGHIYWTDEGAGAANPPKIMRGSMQGSAAGASQPLVQFPLGLGARGIVLDLAGGKMYWTGGSPPEGKIQRANFADGSNVEDWVTSDSPTPGLGIDPVARQLYWGSLSSWFCGSEGRIQRASLDDTGRTVKVEDVVTGLTFVRSLTVDAERGWLYWSEMLCGVNVIRRVALSDLPIAGAQVPAMISGPRARGMALDLVTNKIYWSADSAPPVIQRASTTGSPVAETVLSVLYTAEGIALVPGSPADLNGDGHVNGIDLALLLGQWTGGATYSPCPPTVQADMNDDCKINGIDLAMLLGAWTS